MRIMIIAAAAMTLAACRAGVDEAKVRSELQAANAAYDRALVAGDAKALRQMYTDDFQIIDDDANVSDKKNQVEFMTEELDLLDARSDEVKVTPLGDDAALLTGRFTGRYMMNGQENAFTERYTSVWVRDGDSWKIRQEHPSLMPRPSIAAM